MLWLMLLRFELVLLVNWMRHGQLPMQLHGLGAAGIGVVVRVESRLLRQRCRLRQSVCESGSSMGQGHTVQWVSKVFKRAVLATVAVGHLFCGGEGSLVAERGRHVQVNGLNGLFRDWEHDAHALRGAVRKEPGSKVAVSVHVFHGWLKGCKHRERRLLVGWCSRCL